MVFPCLFQCFPLDMDKKCLYLLLLYSAVGAKILGKLRFWITTNFIYISVIWRNTDNGNLWRGKTLWQKRKHFTIMPIRKLLDDRTDGCQDWTILKANKVNILKKITLMYIPWGMLTGNKKIFLLNKFIGNNVVSLFMN